MLVKILLCILAIIVLAGIGVILVDSNRFVVREYTVSSDKADRDYNFIFLSDLHNKSYGSKNKRLVKAIRNIPADMILAGGDIMTARKHAHFNNAVQFLKDVSGYCNLYYAFGNHESRAKKREDKYGDLFIRYEKAINDAGVVIRDNDWCGFGNVRVYGLTIPEDFYNKKIFVPMKTSDVTENIGTCQKEYFNILLAHDPAHFDAYSEWGADVVLAGHMHGGVVRIPGHKGIISPRYNFFPEYDGGEFKKGNSTMIISRGLGMHTIPFRMFNPAEIVVLHVKKD